MHFTSTNVTIFLKNIFARVWALWAFCAFILTFLIIFIPSLLTYLLPNRRGQVIFIIIAKIWMNVWLWLVLCPLKIKGKHNFKLGETYIVTFNHNSLLDVSITCPYVPGANKTIAKDSFAKIPLFGLFYRKGAILVNRKSNISRRRSYEAMKATLASKMHMCIFPEGTRNRTNEPLKIFYDGAFKLATETQTPIVPSLLFNTKKALPNNHFFYLLPHQLELHFLDPIYPQNYTTAELKEIVFKKMWDYYVANQ